MKKRTKVWVNPEYYTDFLGLFNCSNTSDSYRADLSDFFFFVNGKSPDKLIVQDFIDFRDHIVAHKSPSTVNRQMSTLKSFMKWAVETGKVATNHALNVRVPKREVLKPTKALTDVEVKQMIGAAEGMDKLMLMFMFYLALRRTELIEIKEEDITKDGDHLVLTIIGKGGKLRRLPLNNQLVVELKAYMKTKAKHTTSVFPVSWNYPYRLIKKLAKELSLDANYSAHSARATAISHLLDTAKTPLRDVAHFAGHSSVTTTMLYDKKRDGLDNSAAYEVSY